MKNWIIIALIAALAMCATLGVVAAATGQSEVTVIVAQETASGDMRLYYYDQSEEEWLYHEMGGLTRGNATGTLVWTAPMTVQLPVDDDRATEVEIGTNWFCRLVADLVGVPTFVVEWALQLFGIEC